jgi:hypothetical protein
MLGSIGAIIGAGKLGHFQKRKSIHTEAPALIRAFIVLAPFPISARFRATRFEANLERVRSERSG